MESMRMFSYAAYENGHSSGSSIFALEDLCARFGPLAPTGIAKELFVDALAVTQHSSELSQDALQAEVQSLQAWKDSANSALVALERRSALSFLGLGMDADSDAVHRDYRQKALVAHPDKGGSEEDFLNLQVMVSRLQDEDVKMDEDTVGPRCSNLFQNLKEMMRQAKEREERAKNEEKEMSDGMKLTQKRAALHDQTLKYWERAQDARHQLELKPDSIPRSESLLAPLHRLVASLSEDIALV